MGPFLFPSVRRKKVEWLVEEVLVAHARYPNAKLSYIGHSNGTYLLAKALEVYAEVEQFKFDRVVFAGSVVRSDYDWDKKRVTSVLNLVANRDWVVAFFPQMFELIPIQDLGSAGHNGFSRVEYNREYADGGHGAGIQNTFWDPIANFILNQDSVSSEKHASPGVQAATVSRVGWVGKIMRIFGKFTPLPVWALLVALLVVIFPKGILNLWAVISGYMDEAFVSLLPPIIAWLLVVWLSVSSYIKSGLTAALRSGVSTMIVVAFIGFVAHLMNFTLSQPQSWGSGLIVAYLVLVVWVLRRV
jgi:hypothetical protein